MKPAPSPSFRDPIHRVLGVAVLWALAWFTPAFASDPNHSVELTGSIPIPSAFKNAAASGEGGPAPAGATAETSPWWTVFGDSVLNRLEDQALASNQDLQGAITRVTEARATASAVAADLYPKVSAPLEASRQHTTNTGPVTTSRLVGAGFGPAFPTSFAGQALSNTYSDFQVPLTVSYEIDVFGRVGHARGQARANAEASLADREAVKLSLTSQVAANYFALRTADSEVAVLQRAVGIRHDAEQVQDRRVKGGTASDVDLLRARVEAATTEADLIDAVQERGDLENALAELCGQSASSFHLANQPLESLAPPAVPGTVPAQLLSQRPDLVEAERRIAAANEGVKAARAQFYPAISVQGGYGFESSQENQLLENQSHTWSIAGAINIPIFDGGRNSADLKIARARNEEAYEAYRETALKAFREVEDALSNLRQRSLQAEARKRAAEDAGRVFEASQRSYTEGGLTYFEVIDSQRVLLNAELAQVRTLSNRYAAMVDLIRALGGGFGASASADK
jgi:outer membrane protein, multidrug efflux system